VLKWVSIPKVLLFAHVVYFTKRWDSLCQVDAEFSLILRQPKLVIIELDMGQGVFHRKDSGKKNVEGSQLIERTVEVLDGRGRG
jgi:hypothetical protein